MQRRTFTLITWGDGKQVRLGGWYSSTTQDADPLTLSFKHFPVFKCNLSLWASVEIPCAETCCVRCYRKASSVGERQRMSPLMLAKIWAHSASRVSLQSLLSYSDTTCCLTTVITSPWTSRLSSGSPVPGRSDKCLMAVVFFLFCADISLYHNQKVCKCWGGVMQDLQLQYMGEKNDKKKTPSGEGDMCSFTKEAWLFFTISSHMKKLQLI